MNLSNKNNKVQGNNINIVSKKLRITTFLILALALTTLSCKDSKKDQIKDQKNTEINTSNEMTDSKGQNSDAMQILADYMVLKDALVETNESEAAKAGKKLESSLDLFNLNNYPAKQQKELKDIILDAKEHAEHIGKSEMSHQREHFKILSKDIIDMIAITGTKNTLYQQFCPMYDGGSAWLSLDKNIKNPYYGSKMMTCGKVEREIN